MQAHHDHCKHDEIDQSLKRMIHDFETLYEDCTIARKYDPALTMCPDVDCSTAGIDLVNAKDSTHRLRLRHRLLFDPVPFSVS